MCPHRIVQTAVVAVSACLCQHPLPFCLRFVLNDAVTPHQHRFRLPQVIEVFIRHIKCLLRPEWNTHEALSYLAWSHHRQRNSSTSIWTFRERKEENGGNHFIWTTSLMIYLISNLFAFGATGETWSLDYSADWLNVPIPISKWWTPEKKKKNHEKPNYWHALLLTGFVSRTWSSGRTHWRDF